MAGKVHLLELFSSEAAQVCPSADASFAKLVAREKLWFAWCRRMACGLWDYLAGVIRLPSSETSERNAPMWASMAVALGLHALLCPNGWNGEAARNTSHKGYPWRLGSSAEGGQPSHHFAPSVIQERREAWVCPAQRQRNFPFTAGKILGARLTICWWSKPFAIRPCNTQATCGARHCSFRKRRSQGRGSVGDPDGIAPEQRRCMAAPVLTRGPTLAPHQRQQRLPCEMRPPDSRHEMGHLPASFMGAAADVRQQNRILPRPATPRARWVRSRTIEPAPRITPFFKSVDQCRLIHYRTARDIDEVTIGAQPRAAHRAFTRFRVASPPGLETMRKSHHSAIP